MPSGERWAQLIGDHSASTLQQHRGAATKHQTRYLNLAQTEKRSGLKKTEYYFGLLSYMKCDFKKQTLWSLTTCRACHISVPFAPKPPSLGKRQQDTGGISPDHNGPMYCQILWPKASVKRSMVLVFSRWSWKALTKPALWMTLKSHCDTPSLQPMVQ